jgi:hypothetical protein
MSWSERSVRYHKIQTDAAIHRAFARLDDDGSSVGKFHELLHCVRNRATRLLESPVSGRYHPGVEALVNLARFRNAHIRRAGDWPGTKSTWRLAVSSLAQHLVGKYEVPRFLASSWYSIEGASPDQKRGWFVAHARGASFRSLHLPIAMTRRMERIFLASHDHLTIEHAIRRAELLVLGAPAEVVEAVLASRLGTDLSNGDFWRTVLIFLVGNANIVDPLQIGPMIDYVQAIRHDRVPMETPSGTVELDPPQPTFAIKGRTVQSMLRLMRDWHGSLGSGGASLTWTRSQLQPMVVAEPGPDASDPPRVWQLTELTNSAELRTEGAALHHCVASYASRCSRGMSRILSLRCRRGDKVHHVLTIEVDPKRRAVVQARGLANRAATGKPRQLLQEWAARERIHLDV